MDSLVEHACCDERADEREPLLQVYRRYTGYTGVYRGPDTQSPHAGVAQLGPATIKKVKNRFRRSNVESC